MNTHVYHRDISYEWNILEYRWHAIWNALIVCLKCCRQISAICWHLFSALQYLLYSILLAAANISWIPNFSVLYDWMRKDVEMNSPGWEIVPYTGLKWKKKRICLFDFSHCYTYMYQTQFASFFLQKAKNIYFEVKSFFSSRSKEQTECITNCNNKLKSIFIEYRSISAMVFCMPTHDWNETCLAIAL